MINQKKILYLLLIFFLYFSNSIASENVAFIDLDYIFANSTKGKNIISKLEKLDKSSKAEFDSREKLIIELDKEINQQKNIMDKNELSTKIDNLKKMVNDLRLFKNNQTDIYNQKKNSELKVFFNDINPLIKEYMIKNSISIIFDKKNIFLADNNVDITEQILNIINK